MNLTLKRFDYGKDGIFGELLDDTGRHVCYTLEHAYPKTTLEQTSPTTNSQITRHYPKMDAGTYTCNRGQHRLASNMKWFETFEIEKVPRHFDILFHKGNYNEDSAGCVLVGTSIQDYNDPGHGHGKMLASSKIAFEKFLALQSGINSFTLTVTN